VGEFTPVAGFRAHWAAAEAKVLPLLPICTVVAAKADVFTTAAAIHAADVANRMD
jgi:hypothetical protein